MNFLHSTTRTPSSQLSNGTLSSALPSCHPLFHAIQNNTPYIKAKIKLSTAAHLTSIYQGTNASQGVKASEKPLLAVSLKHLRKSNHPRNDSLGSKSSGTYRTVIRPKQIFSWLEVERFDAEKCYCRVHIHSVDLQV